MAEAEPFKEDFFERVVDVKWETEPEVFWLIGSGNPFFVNGLNYGDLCAYVWRSSDGKRWFGTNLGVRGSDFKGFGGLYTGAWMRVGLEYGADPVWVLGGTNTKLQPGSCVSYSLDGEFFPLANRTFFDERHGCQRMFGFSASGQVVIDQMILISTQLHFDYFYSTDGQKWTPPNYHGGEEPAYGRAAAPTAEPAALPAPRVFNSQPSSTLLSVTDPNPGAFDAPMESLVPKDGDIVAPAMEARSAEIDTFASSTTPVNKAAEKVYIGTAISATGKVRKGPFRGKRLTITIFPYHSPPGGGSHGDNTVRVVDDKGKLVGIFNSRIKRSMSIGYGHYVFVVVGSGNIGTGQNDSMVDSALAWSEDGINWKRVGLGFHNQINAIAVGPRPTGRKPTPPRKDETTTGGVAVGTGKVPPSGPPPTP